MRVRLLALIAAALTGLLGPSSVGASGADETTPVAGASATATDSPEGTQGSDNGPVEGPSHVQAASEPTGGPEQGAGASAGASIGNDATVGQVSGQGQDAGTGASSAGSRGAAQANPAAERDQLAHTGQQADAAADASVNGAKNGAKEVRNGQTDAGDGGPIGQTNSSNAAAEAAASQATSQEAGPGTGTVEASGDQAASAAANAKADQPKNSIVNARVEAPGHDAGFEQSNSADARAAAAAKREESADEREEKAAERAEDARRGEDVAQEARATASAELEQPTNTAVELRLFSDGDTAGSSQSSSALAEAVVVADGPDAAASASAEISEPTNTFVSLRVNSEGMTEPVVQETLEQETESVNGTSVTRIERDAEDRTWESTDPASGLEITFTADGENTDLRIALDDPALPKPSDGTVFVWTWDLVFGPGGQLACAIGSSSADGLVTWSFDCDPEDEITRAAGAAAPAPTEGALSWTWTWLRPDLPNWVWDYADVIPIPTCSAGCTYVLDFNWLSHEPVALAGVAPAGTNPELDARTPSVDQVNEASASAVATATSEATQIVTQTADAGSAPLQIVLQELHVLQVASARAAAQLSDVANTSVGAGESASQSTRAAVEAESRLAATTVQQIAQHAGGEDSLQAQAALQLTNTTQVLVSVGVATLVGASNTDLSLGGVSTQASSSAASAVGAESATARQTIEQEQTGDGADQDQIAGQWSEVVQDLQLVAAAGLHDARNESSLRDESSSLRIDADAESTGSSRSAVTQLAVQLQNGDTTALQQESLQQAIVEQTGVVLAAASAGTIRLVYATPPPAAAPPAAERAPAQLDVAAAAVAQGRGELRAAPTVFVAIDVAPARGRRGPAPQGARAPERAAPAPAGAAPRAAASAPRVAAASTSVITFSASAAGREAGSSPIRGEDAAKAAGRSSGGPCVAPLGGAAAVTAGSGSGSALVALSGYVLTPLPRLGRRVQEPAGRRPAAVALSRARPG